MVEQKLEEMGYTYDNGMVSKWMSEDKKKPQAAPKENAAKAGAAVGIAAVFGMIAGLGAAGAELAMSVFSNKTAVKQQMLFYGVLNLYNNHLEEFMQA